MSEPVELIMRGSSYMGDMMSWSNTGEEIVRCRDCGRAYRRGGGVYCSRVLQWGSNDRPAPLPVNPDGFCAWGERKEGR